MQKQDNFIDKRSVAVNLRIALTIVCCNSSHMVQMLAILSANASLNDFVIHKRFGVVGGSLRALCNIKK